MVMHFSYKQVTRPDGTDAKIPAVPVTFVGKRVIDVVALVDSGADISVIPKDMGKLLGLDLSGKVEYAYGIGGKVRTVEKNLDIVIEKGHERYNFRIPIKVVLDEYDFPPLLGRAVFFNEFIITIKEDNQRISLKKYNPRNY